MRNWLKSSYKFQEFAHWVLSMLVTKAVYPSFKMCSIKLIFVVAFYTLKEYSYYHHFRGGLFTPDQAFDVIVRDRISRLLPPTLSCVDQVVSKLSSIVHTCLEGVGPSPPFETIFTFPYLFISLFPM